MSMIVTDTAIIRNPATCAIAPVSYVIVFSHWAASDDMEFAIDLPATDTANPNDFLPNFEEMEFASENDANAWWAANFRTDEDSPITPVFTVL